MKSPEADDYTLAIAGTGAMGQGIAQVAAAGGVQVLLYDTREGAATAAFDTVAGRLTRLVEKGRMSAAEADAAIDRLHPVPTTADFAPADAVVEAIVEDLDAKRGLFTEVEAVVGPDCLIASNTSSIPIAAIARACKKRDRIAGLHFFNPVPLMKLVEVIRAAETSDAAVAALTALGKRLTRVPVTVKDSPGFLVNMGGRAFTTEGLRIVHEGVATPAQVDAVMRDCWGFRMGPFELMDLTGIDVNYPVSQIVWEGYQGDQRLETRPNHRAMFDAGLLGRKTGQGWYAYEGGKPAPGAPSPDHVTGAAPARRVCLAEEFLEQAVSDMVRRQDGGPGNGADEDAHDDGPEGEDLLSDAPLDPAVQEFCEEIGLEIVPDDGVSPIVAAPIGQDATTIATICELDHRRLVCIDLLGNPAKRVTVMTAPGADPAARDALAAAIAESGRKVTAITDSPGFVGQRVAAMVANLGCYMAEIGLASPEDIDTAMQLGLNYPHGPLALAEQIGAPETLDVLKELHETTGEDRYRPTMWLKRRAMLGLPVHTPS